MCRHPISSIHVHTPTRVQQQTDNEFASYTRTYVANILVTVLEMAATSEDRLFHSHDDDAMES